MPGLRKLLNVPHSAFERMGMPKRTWCADLKMSPGSICAIVCVARVSVVAGAMAAGDGASIEVGGEGRPNLPRQARCLALGAFIVTAVRVSWCVRCHSGSS